MGLSNKRRVFVEEYLKCWNATEAARRAGYKHPNKRGPELVVNSGIQEKIQERLDEKKLSADEVLTRLAAQATTDLIEFVDENGIIDWKALKQAVRERGGPLVKKIVHTKGQRVSLELYDAQAALTLLGRHHGLFKDRVIHAGDPEQPLEVSLTNFTAEEIRRLAEACRKIGAGGGGEGDGG